jgi:hypothetical protein
LVARPTQVITKVVLGIELTTEQRIEFENDFRVWLKHVSLLGS